MDVLWLLSRASQKGQKTWSGQSTSTARDAPIGIRLNDWFGVARPD